MKYFAFLLLSLSIAFQTVNGQGIVKGGAIGASASPFLHHVTPAPSAPFSTLSSDVAISYFNPLLPMIDVSAPYVGTGLVPEYGERITLPGVSGYLDSVRITLDAISSDSVVVDYFSDTLYATAQGGYHLMNIFDQNSLNFTIGYIHASDIHGRTTVTIPVPHTELLNENFWIAVAPNYDPVAGNFTNTFELVGDSEAIVPRTADNTHSGFIAEGGGQVFSGVFDSTFPGAGGAATIFRILYHRVRLELPFERDIQRCHTRTFNFPKSRFFVYSNSE